jgi:hypothetical protein
MKWGNNEIAWASKSRISKLAKNELELASNALLLSSPISAVIVSNEEDF